MRDTFTRCLEAYAETHPELVLVTGDLGFGVLFPYMKKFPDRFINAGISEQAMMSMAAGMALEGKTVVVYSIGYFPTLRCLEQIRNCCAYHEVNVKIVCVGAGFVYGTLGMTHHATEDMSALRILPGVKVYAPADGVETEAVMGPFLSEPGVAYLRIGRGGEPHFHADGSLAGYRCGQALEQFPGTDAYLLTAGGILGSAVEAARLLEADGLAVGFACICRESRPFVERPGSCEVAALYLRREWQGRGLGRRLLAFCLDQLPPGKAVVLFVAKGNGKAAGFYRRMGFSPTGRVLRDETPWGPVEEEEWMGCCR